MYSSTLFWILMSVGLMNLSGCRTAPPHAEDLEGASGKSPQDISDYQKPSMGIQFSQKIFKVDPRWAQGAERALRMETVFPYFPAAQAGLRSGDYLIAINEEPFRNLPNDYASQLVQKIRTWPLKTKVRFKVIRLRETLNTEIQAVPVPSQEKISSSPQDFAATEEILAHLSEISEWNNLSKKTQKAELLDFEIEVVAKKWSYGDRELNSDSLAEVPGDLQVSSLLQRKVEKAVENLPETAVNSAQKSQFRQETQDLFERLSSLDQYRDPLRIPRVGWIFRNPWSIEAYQSQQLQRLRSCRETSAGMLSCYRKILRDAGFKIEGSEVNVETSFTSPRDFLQKVNDADSLSDALAAKAFARLSEEELAFLKKESLEIPQQLLSGIYLHDKSEESLRLRNARWMSLIEKVDLAKLFASVRPYQQLFTKNNLQKLKALIEATGRSQNRIVEEIIQNKKAYLIGGSGNNDYNSHKQYQIAFIFDVGGDDFYPDVGGPIIDWSGNDRYEASRPFSEGAAVFKVSWLEDFQGDDTYICQTGCFGSSILGVSVFIDHQGNDIYRTQNFSLASTLVGFSLFADFAGRDQYFSTSMSQGLGVAGGLSLMFDLRGEDLYYCKGSLASSYEDPGEFDGWCQGMGLGLRQFASGGMGILYDGQGQDEFEAGTFSQGGGYFFGLGAFYNDGKQNDIYRGSRYTQGFSAHQAIGMFYEDGGNDRYLSPSFVGEGMAWDLSVSLFVDLEGNDTYKTCEHCLGVGSQNSLAIFEDLGGEDTYVGEGLPYSSKRYNDYHGGSSLGVFMDQGGAKDHYEKLQNKTKGLYPGWQVLIDQ